MSETSTPPITAPAGAPGGGSLRRVLKLRHLVAFGLAYLAPTVVFNLYGIVTEMTGGMMALAYLITTVVMFFTAYSYAVMVKEYPIAGSAYTYVRRAVNPWLGFFTGWVMLLDYLLLPMVCYLLVGIYMNTFVPAVPVAVWVIGLAVLVAAINIVGVKTAGRINTVVVGAQILFCVAVVVIAGVYVSQGGGDGVLLDPKALLNVETFDGPNLLWASSILAAAFLGFDAVSTMAEETVEPRKTVPRAIMIVCVGGGAAFAVISYFTQIAWPTAYRDLTDPDTGVFELLPRIGGDALATTFLVIDNFGSVICALVGLAAVSRLLFGMGRDGVLPRRFFGKLSTRFGTPVNNILLTSAIALTALLYADNLLGAASLVSFGALSGFIMVNYSVISHFFIRGKRRSGTDVIRYLVVPGLGVLVCLVLWLNVDLSAKLLGLAWLTVGIVYMAIRSRGFRRPPPSMQLDEDVDADSDEAAVGNEQGR